LYRSFGQPAYATLLVYVLAVLVILSVVLRFRQYRLWEVALLCVLALLANIAARSVQDWVFIMLAVGVPQLGVLRTPAKRWRTRPVLRRHAWLLFSAGTPRRQPLCSSVKPGLATTPAADSRLWNGLFPSGDDRAARALLAGFAAVSRATTLL